MTTSEAHSEFRRLYEGRLSGLLKWDEVDALFARLSEEAEGWYVYDLAHAPPDTPLSGSDLLAKLMGIHAWSFQRNREDPLCGSVFVNNRANPELVKVYDPLSGSSCSVTTPLPLYVISRMSPEHIPFDAPELMFDDGSGRSLFDRLLGRKRR